MPYVILLRHGKSEWNEKGLWTGHTDVDLAESGKQEARLAAEAIRDIAIHKIHVSDLKRAQQTMNTMAFIPEKTNGKLRLKSVRKSSNGCGAVGMCRFRKEKP
jgi:bisphosphoglycerate-dependent phosphoglycerate mutase